LYSDSSIIKISRFNEITNITLSEDVLPTSIKNCIIADENENIFLFNIENNKIVKVNLTWNKIFTYGGGEPFTNGFMDDLNGTSLAAISYTEGALYLVTLMGYIKRIQGIVDTKKLLTKLETDYLTLATTKSLTSSPTITLLISDTRFTLYTHILTCRFPSVNSFMYQHDSYVPDINEPSLKRVCFT